MLKQKLITLLLLFICCAQMISACSLKRAGENAAREIRFGMEESSRRLQNSLETSSRIVSASISEAASRLEILGRSVSSEFGQSIRQASRDLVRVSHRVSDSIDHGVHEMSSVLKEGIHSAHEISDRLLKSADKAVDKLGGRVDNAVIAIREISANLLKSIDKGVQDLQITLRYVADKMAEMAKQIEVKVDSNHLVEVANTTGDFLLKSVKELTTNWEVNVNTVHLNGAAAELSKALQNLQFRLGIDHHLRMAILYVSIAVGISCSVFFVAMIIALKRCRSCTKKTWLLLCKSAPGPAQALEGRIETTTAMPTKNISEGIENPTVNHFNRKSQKVFDETPLISL